MCKATHLYKILSYTSSMWAQWRKGKSGFNSLCCMVCFHVTGLWSINFTVSIIIKVGIRQGIVLRVIFSPVGINYYI